MDIFINILAIVFILPWFSGILFGILLALSTYARGFITAMQIEKKQPPTLSDKVKIQNFFYPQVNSYRLYPYDRGWRIIKYIISNTFNHASRQGSAWFRVSGSQFSHMKSTDNNWVRIWDIFSGTLMVIIGIPVYIVTMVFLSLFFVLHSILLFIWALLIGIQVALYQIPTSLLSFIKRFVYHCPNCYQTMLTAAYVCPKCREKHTRLWPSHYGLFFHRCTCGKYLPVLGILGKSRLLKVCPQIDCLYPLPSVIGRTKACHYALVGGPSTGKTNYIIASIRELMEVQAQLENIEIVFSIKSQEEVFQSYIHALDSGLDLPKTTQETPFAILLKLKQRGKSVPHLIYLYDAAGEVFQDIEKARKQRYFEHLDAFIFMIDPFAIPDYYEINKVGIQAQLSSIRPGDKNTEVILSQVIEILTPYAKKKRANKSLATPCAITLSKVDALDLEREIGLPATHKLMENDPMSTQDIALSQLAIDFLIKYGMGNEVLNIKSIFANHQFFSCSSLYRRPGEIKITPLRTLSPLLWIMKEANNIDLVPRNW